MEIKSKNKESIIVRETNVKTITTIKNVHYFKVLAEL